MLISCPAIECGLFRACRNSKILLSFLYIFKRKSILNAADCICYKSSPKNKFPFMFAFFLSNFFYVNLPLEIVDCLDIRTITFSTVAQKMLLLLCNITLTVKSTPRGLVFTSYVSAHTSVQKQ